MSTSGMMIIILRRAHVDHVEQKVRILLNRTRLPRVTTWTSVNKHEAPYQIVLLLLCICSEKRKPESEAKGCFGHLP